MNKYKEGKQNIREVKQKPKVKRKGKEKRRIIETKPKQTYYESKTIWPRSTSSVRTLDIQLSRFRLRKVSDEARNLLLIRGETIENRCERELNPLNRREMRAKSARRASQIQVEKTPRKALRADGFCDCETGERAGEGREWEQGHEPCPRAGSGSSGTGRRRSRWPWRRGAAGGGRGEGSAGATGRWCWRGRRRRRVGAGALWPSLFLNPSLVGEMLPGSPRT